MRVGDDRNDPQARGNNWNLVLDVPEGMFIQRPKFSLDEIRAVYPFPAVIDGKPVLEWRNSETQYDYTRWILFLNTMRAGYTQDRWFVLCPSDWDRVRERYDEIYPYRRLYDVAKAGANADMAAWNKLFIKAENAYHPPLPDKAAVTYLVQGYSRHPKQGEFRQCVMVLQKSAAISLEDLLEQEHPGYNGDPDNFAARYVVGNIFPIDQNDGKVLMSGKEGWYAQNANNDSNDFGQQAGARKEFEGYETKLVPLKEMSRFRLPTRGPTVEQIINAWCPWERVVRRMTTEEQIDMLKVAFYSTGSVRTDLLLKRAFDNYGTGHQTAVVESIAAGTVPSAASRAQAAEPVARQAPEENPFGGGSAPVAAPAAPATSTPSAAEPASPFGDADAAVINSAPVAPTASSAPASAPAGSLEIPADVSQMDEQTKLILEQIRASMQAREEKKEGK